jgi:hypothetical protein
LRCSDAGGAVILLDQSSKFTKAVSKSGTFARLADGPHLLRNTATPEVGIDTSFMSLVPGVKTH